MILPLWIVGLLVAGAQASSQVSSIKSQAHQLPSGKYYVQNVGSGQKLIGDRNNLHPGSGKGTVVAVVPHFTGKDRHTVLGVTSGGDNKCVSAAWNANKGSDGTGSMYSCVLGSLAKGKGSSSLRQDKQAFFLVPASGKARRDLEDLDTRDLTAHTENSTELEKRGRHRRHRSHHKKSHHHSRKSSKSGSHGPYYIIASDHLQDQAPRALSGQTASYLGQKVMSLATWHKGNKSQQWVFLIA